MQPKLLKNPEHQKVPSGPIFEFGPGWGAKIKKWCKKYILASDCSLCRNTRYILLAGIIILALFWPRLKLITMPKQTPAAFSAIELTIQKNEGKIKLARRAVSDYLAKFPDPALTAGQKIYMETTLGQNINGEFEVGLKILFPIENIKSALEKSKSLTPSQLQRWEASAKKVRF